MDKEYFLIRLDNKKKIELYYFNNYINNIKLLNSFIYPICFTASNSYLMFNLISLHTSLNILSTQHKLYLGREICKAEIAIEINQQYIQN
uniref:DUF4346 domain-containing protein n=1 Tax=Dasyclonium flaccidum TaxID=2007274 RepID=A0A1Z1MLG5_9FLOR|nr:hypothetical protein [Dasyclonium flaccidum]ARW66591.1 hypothetical protein [Dasyclonium flaccidum]